MKVNNVLFYIKFIILLSEINYYVCQNCSRENPFLKEDTCVLFCSIDEIYQNICKIQNMVIKTQFLNNIISIGDEDFVYPNVVTSENNNLYFISSSYPGSNLRKIYILNHEGYVYYNRTNPFININILNYH